MVQVGVEARVKLVGGVGAVRPVICRGSVRSVQVLTLTVDWRDACTVTSPVVAVVDLVCTLRGNSCVLFNTNTVSASLVDGSVEVPANSLASSLNHVSMLEGWSSCKLYVNHANTLLDCAANSAARVAAGHCEQMCKWSS